MTGPPPTEEGGAVTREQLVCWIGIDAQLEPRPGGRFRFEITDGQWCSGRYLEVVQGRRVVSPGGAGERRHPGPARLFHRRGRPGADPVASGLPASLEP